MDNITYRVSYRSELGYGSITVNSYDTALEYAKDHDGSYIDKVYEKRVWTYEDQLANKEKSIGEQFGQAVADSLTEMMDSIHLVNILSNLSSKALEEIIREAKEKKHNKLASKVGAVFKVNTCEDTYWICNSFKEGILYGMKYCFSEGGMRRHMYLMPLPNADTLTQVDKEVFRRRISKYLKEYAKRISAEIEANLESKN